MNLRRIKQSELAEVRSLLHRSQRGRCPLCTIKITELSEACVDHDHQSGFIRAVLCRNCNSMNGKVMNCANRAKREMTRLEWLDRMVEYEKKHLVCQTGLLHPLHRTEEEKRLRRNKKAKKRRKLLLNK